MLYALTQVFHALPELGGVLDQDVALIRMLAVLREAGVVGDGDEPLTPESDDDPFAGIQMITLG